MNIRTIVSVVFFALVALLTPSRATAGLAITDGSGALHLDVYTWDGRVCAVRPAVPGAAGACLPSDASSVSALLPVGPADVVNASVVHFDAWDLRIVAARFDVNAATFDGVDQEGLVAEARQSLRASLPTGARLVSEGIDEQQPVQRMGGSAYLRATPVLDVASGGGRETVASVAFFVPSSRGVYSVAFFAAPARATDAARVADNAIASLVASPPPRVTKNIFNAAAYRAGQLTRLALVAAVAVSLVMWLRARKKADAKRAS